MALGTVPPTALLPIGHYQGQIFAGGAEAPSEFNVRLGNATVDVSHPGFVVWAAAHGSPPGKLVPPWTRAATMQAVQLEGIDTPELIIDSLIELGLLAEIDTTASGQIEFAERHRAFPLMVGLGNDAARPTIFQIGFPGQPVIGIPLGLYYLWGHSHIAADLWDACQESARAYEGTELRDYRWADPVTLLSDFITAMPELLAANACYLDVA